MGRLLAIDYGAKRVGLAVTDPLKMIATALDTVHAQDTIQYLLDYTQKEEVEAFVLGMPKNLNNTDTHATGLAREFAKILAKKIPDIPIHLHDERFTSKIALDAMIAGGTSKKYRQNKANIDKVSAVIILQSYLESQGGGNY